MSLLKLAKESTLPIVFCPLQKLESGSLNIDQVHHLRVRRQLVDGQQILVSNQHQAALAKLILGPGKKVSFTSLNIETLPRPRQKTALFLPILKKDPFIWALVKSIELGIDTIYPLISERSQNRQWPSGHKNFHKHIELACAQSRQLICPSLQDPIHLEHLDSLELEQMIVACWRTEQKTLPKQRPPLSGKIGLIVGPEGGWSQTDQNILKKAYHLNLSSNILRAETAAIVLCGRVLSWLET